jgi:nickel-dependent lactate racemase
VSDLLVGSGYEHFLAAADEHAQSCEIRSSRRYDLVVASCGGYPKDINLIQAHKAIHNASMWVRDGGELIVLAECRDGIGSKTFLPWFDFPGRSEAFAALAGDYRGNGGTALSFMEKRERIRIGMVTDLSIEECRKIGVARLVPQEVQTRIGSAATVALIPNASLLVKR